MTRQSRGLRFRGLSVVLIGGWACSGAGVGPSVVSSGNGVGGGCVGGGCGGWSWTTSTTPDVVGAILTVTWFCTARFSGRVKLMGSSSSGALKVSVLDPPGAAP